MEREKTSGLSGCVASATNCCVEFYTVIGKERHQQKMTHGKKAKSRQVLDEAEVGTGKEQKHRAGSSLPLYLYLPMSVICWDFSPSSVTSKQGIRPLALGQAGTVADVIFGFE
ncbi:hypothetical protein WISP_123293 [Willisornis vidua]|uniref:Uncharacterized protein n=1 Tax=Willisornis vidua TaxID=1566151 RepID=A0ABQ9CS12_9PASS|nr:hypothetical protein WISP_123293 [Willisornis vidua]